MSQAKIHVKFSQPGFHNWPNPTASRSYLGNSHRHLFQVEVVTWVTHDEREIEFHDLRDEGAGLFKALGNAAGNMGGMSCEMMARKVAQQLAVKHKRAFEVSVWEDGEVGATVYCSP